MSFLRSKYCLWSYLISKHQSVCMQNTIKLIRHVILTTTAPKQHRNTAQKETDRVVQGTDSCALPSVDLHQLPAAIALDSGALLVIYKPKHTKSAICALTRMHTNQPKGEERRYLLCGVVVYILSRPLAVERRASISNQTPLCPTNSAMSTRASQKSEGEGGGKGLT